MTKKEFLEGMRDLAEDFADPDGDFQTLIKEMEGEEAQELIAFDPGLAPHLVNLVTAVRGLGEYVRSRQS